MVFSGRCNRLGGVKRRSVLDEEWLLLPQWLANDLNFFEGQNTDYDRIFVLGINLSYYTLSVLADYNEVIFKYGQGSSYQVFMQPALLLPVPVLPDGLWLRDLREFLSEIFCNPQRFPMNVMNYE